MYPATLLKSLCFLVILLAGSVSSRAESFSIAIATSTDDPSLRQSCIKELITLMENDAKWKRSGPTAMLGLTDLSDLVNRKNLSYERIGEKYPSRVRFAFGKKNKISISFTFRSRYLSKMESQVLQSKFILTIEKHYDDFSIRARAPLYDAPNGPATASDASPSA